MWMESGAAMKPAIVARLVPLTLVVAVPARAQDTTRLPITRAESVRSRSGPAEHFTGEVSIRPLFDCTTSTRASGAVVTFAAGARTAWHSHPRGQILMVTEGLGRVQLWGEPVQEIRAGDVVRIPAGRKHWHGAAPDQAMSHIAVQEHLNGAVVQWAEQVSETQYAALPVTVVDSQPRPTAGRDTFGDIAPKLAQLTDDVLFGDVWARPGLSPRDRSLVTVSALIAMNRPDQLRSHIARARDNGVTEGELIETITHLAFYAGWPSAVTAIGVARDIFRR
jgi:4-carboxymuconolactone decarboxylase